VKRTLGVPLFAALNGVVAILVGSELFRAHHPLPEQMQTADAILKTFPPERTPRPTIFESEEEGNAWEVDLAPNT